jgi:hypothetical protein
MHHGLSLTPISGITPKPYSNPRKNSANYSRPSSPSIHHHKKSSSHDSSVSPYTSSSSDGVPDEVFAMFIEDEYRQSSDNSDDEDEEYANDRNLFDSDEDSDDNLSIEDSFNGWTDDEIINARFASNLSREIERLSLARST